MKNNIMSAALAAAVAASSGASASSDSDAGGKYLSGDFHNHTTCSDGSTSVKTLTRESLSYLDWFIHVGHSGNGARNCNISDFFYFSFSAPKHPGLWVNSLENGAADIKGDPAFTEIGGEEIQEMWRWQSLQEYNLPPIVEERESPQNKGKIAFLGLEWVVPGHEHSSNSISAGNYGEAPNADALAQFEYCFARNSDDTSQGGGQGWTCEISDAYNNKLIKLFAGREVEGIADYNSTLGDAGINTEDAGEHVKSAAGILWMKENFPEESFAVQAHVERQGAFIEDDDEGYNVEHMRDWNTLAPEIAFGFESQPGHQAQYNRGSYNAGRPTSGLYTYGGTGCYAAAEAAKPGYDFDGEALDPHDFLEGGKYPSIDDDEDPAKVTVCRPGVRTMWDALLSEGRRFYSFASSDWHNRGAFGPLDFESTNDFYPGEYQEHFTWVSDVGADPAKTIIKSLRSGDSFHVQGQLISGDLTFVACSRRKCATMGETLKVRKGRRVEVYLIVVDPAGKNNSKYAFNNPSLLQIGIEEPINEPTLRQVDLIKGSIHGMIEPTDHEYFNPLAPETTHIAKSWDTVDLSGYEGEKPGEIKMSYSFIATEDGYIRARGSNIPAGTPNERDADGNPLPDNLSDNIPCEDADCPPHLEGVLTADVEAWADVWFHTNPIFIEVKSRKPHGRNDDRFASFIGK